MNIIYSPDTDTLLIRFSQATIVETHDLTDEVLVSMTIEQTKTRVGLETMSFQTLPSVGPIVLLPSIQSATLYKFITRNGSVL